MKITIYANYGLLAHEKEVVYSTVAADVHGEISVEIPDAYETVSGEVAIELGGRPYMLREVLANANMHGEGGNKNRPVLLWCDEQGYHTRNIIEIKS